MNAKKYNVVLDRGICCAGHGKSIVDAINGVDKNTILRHTMRSVLAAEDALGNNSKSIKVHSFNNTSSETCSAAADYKRILEEEGGQGVISAGLKFEKRHRERGINSKTLGGEGLEREAFATQVCDSNHSSKRCDFQRHAPLLRMP